MSSIPQSKPRTGAVDRAWRRAGGIKLTLESAGSLIENLITAKNVLFFRRKTSAGRFGPQNLAQTTGASFPPKTRPKMCSNPRLKTTLMTPRTRACHLFVG